MPHDVVIFHLDALNRETYEKKFREKIRLKIQSNYSSIFYPNCYGFDTTLTSMHATFFPETHLQFANHFSRYDKIIRGNNKNDFIKKLKSKAFFTQYYTNDVNSVNPSLPLYEFDQINHIKSNLYQFDQNIVFYKEFKNFIYLHDMTLHDKLGEYVYDSRFSMREYDYYSAVLLERTVKNIDQIFNLGNIEMIIFLSDHGMTINKDENNRTLKVEPKFQISDFKNNVVLEIFSKSLEESKIDNTIISLRDFGGIFNSILMNREPKKFEKNISYFSNPKLNSNRYNPLLNTFVYREQNRKSVIEVYNKQITEYVLDNKLNILPDRKIRPNIRKHLIKFASKHKNEINYLTILSMVTNFYSILINKLRKYRIR